MDFTRQRKQRAEFVAAPALLSASLRELFQKLHLYAEDLCCPGWQFVGISSTVRAFQHLTSPEALLLHLPRGLWSVYRFCWSFPFFRQSSFAKFLPYLLINPFPHLASVRLLKYNLIFFPWSPFVSLHTLSFLFAAAKLFFPISILLMVSVFSLAPTFSKKFLAVTVSIGERGGGWGGVANSWKLCFLSTLPRNCLQPPGSIQRLPFNDLSKGQVLTGIGIHARNIFSHCILNCELQHFIFQDTT